MKNYDELTDTKEARKNRKRRFDARRREREKLIKEVEAATGKKLEVLLKEILEQNRTPD